MANVGHIHGHGDHLNSQPYTSNLFDAFLCFFTTEICRHDSYSHHNIDDESGCDRAIILSQHPKYDNQECSHRTNDWQMVREQVQLQSVHWLLPFYRCRGL